MQTIQLMQLYAKTAPNTTKKESAVNPIEYVSAEKAEKQRDYFCLECNHLLRLRAGKERIPHFYHLNPPLSCRQQAKSLEHIQTQLKIQQQIGRGCLLEVAFPQIQRIADVVWEEEKLIFEVQCSPMTALEAQSRKADYTKAGYQVLFILHDKRFNQRKVSALEACLREEGCYFTNISARGDGVIYDQFDLIERGFRKKQLGQLPIQINKPQRLKGLSSVEMAHLPEKSLLSAQLKKRLLSFEGDLFSLVKHEPQSPYLIEALQIKVQEPSSRHASMALSLWKTLSNYTHLIWRHLLEKCAK